MLWFGYMDKVPWGQCSVWSRCLQSCGDVNILPVALSGNTALKILQMCQWPCSQQEPLPLASLLFPSRQVICCLPLSHRILCSVSYGLHALTHLTQLHEGEALCILCVDHVTEYMEDATMGIWGTRAGRVREEPRMSLTAKCSGKNVQ